MFVTAGRLAMADLLAYLLAPGIGIGPSPLTETFTPLTETFTTADERDARGARHATR